MRRELVLALLFLVVTVSTYLIRFNQPMNAPGNQVTLTDRNAFRRAVLFDGLQELTPTSVFVQEATNLLERSGFSVDFWGGENVTVELLLNLEYYDIILLRLHSAIASNGVLYIFTGELYEGEKYLVLRSSGIVARGVVAYMNKTYFALNSHYLGKNAQTNLTGSIVILMGCKGANDHEFVKSILGRGAKAYIAWDGNVSIEHSDVVTLELLKALIEGGSNPIDAVNRVMNELGPDPHYGSSLQCFTQVST
ncbi:MAG: hypothetical protein QXK88_05180 [Desulfurococcaceae archaeon]